jgi:hypothetical protein
MTFLNLQRGVDLRDEARAEARAILRGFRGFLAEISTWRRAEIAVTAEDETAGNMDSLQSDDHSFEEREARAEETSPLRTGQGRTP